MPDRPVIVEAFRDFPGTVEIVGLGGVRQPRGHAQEVEVGVLVASNLDGLDFDPEQQTAVLWIGCGHFDLLTAGSRWTGGKRSTSFPSTMVTGVFEPMRKEELGLGAHPTARDLRPFPSRKIASRRGFLLRRGLSDAEAQKKQPAGPKFVLLPHLELLRGLFGVGSGLVLEMFDGIRDSDVSSDRGLIDRRRSRATDNGTVVLFTRRWMPRGEALIAAAIIADPAVRTLYRSVFQWLSVHPDWRAGLPVGIELEWPWLTPIPLRAEGRWIERVEDNRRRRRFLVTRLLAIGIPLPFERVEVHHTGSDESDGKDLPPAKSRMRSANAAVVVLTSGRSASPSRRPMNIMTGEVDLSETSEIQVEWSPPTPLQSLHEADRRAYR